MVFVAEGTGYVPVTQLRSRLPAQFRPVEPSSPVAAVTAAGEQEVTEWASSAHNWDRAYHHFGHNQSRVQRKYKLQTFWAQ